MKNTVLVLSAVLVATLLVFPRVSANDQDEFPEFYFTRLVYTQNGYHGRNFTMPMPGPYRCPEFGGRNFFPPQGWGWATDTPGADCKLMGVIHRLTAQHVYPNPNYMEIMD